MPIHYVIEPRMIKVKNREFTITGYYITESGEKLADATIKNALGEQSKVISFSTKRLLMEILDKKRTNFKHK